MAENSELVAENRYEAENYNSTHASDKLKEAFVTYSNMQNADYPRGCVGFPPYGCTKSIGKAYLKINAEFMAKVFKLIKEDEKCVISDARY